MDPLDQPFRLIKTNRGADKLIEGGFVYTKNSRAGEVTHWRCEQRGECKARIHTEGTDIVKRISDHLHAPDNAGVSCCEVKIGVKRRAQGHKIVLITSLLRVYLQCQTVLSLSYLN